MIRKLKDIYKIIFNSPVRVEAPINFHTSWENNDKLRLSKFNNIHQNEDCIIIGNGPSLNKMDLSEIKKYHTFGLNKIHLFKKFDLNLSYLVAVNPLVIEQALEDFETRDIPTFISLENSKEFNFNNSNVYKINSKGAFGFGRKMDEDLYEGGTVTQVALQIAFAMGFKRVALIGVDHNFKQSGDPNAEQKMEQDDENHFDPNYFKGQKWHLADIKANEISYQISEYIYNREKRKVYDATLNGKLNIFEKIDFEFVLKNFKPKN